MSFLEPILDTTRAELTITFNLNLRNVTDNFVYNAFREWGDLSYKLSDGSRAIKNEYCDGAKITVRQANRNGDVWREFTFNDVMITKIDGLSDLDYQSKEALTLNVGFVSDYWDYEIADTVA